MARKSGRGRRGRSRRQRRRADAPPARASGGAEPATPATPAAKERRRDLRAALLLVVAALVVFNLNGRNMGIGDTLPARFIPFAVWKAGTVRLDPVLDATRQGYPYSYWIQRASDGGHASMYPIVAPLLAAPLYAPAAAYLASRAWPPAQLSWAGEVMEKVSGSCIAAVASGLMFLLLRRRMGFRRAVLLAAAFALGTETWVIGSQALWQHGTAELLLVVALLAVTGPPTATGLLLAGGACGLVIANRPFDLPLAAAFALYAPLWAGGRRALWFFLAAAVPIALALAYNLATFGELGGGYAIAIKSTGSPSFFTHPIGRGLIEMLFSPGKGLFPFTPFLLFLFLPLFRRRPPAAPDPRPAAAQAAGTERWRQLAPIRWLQAEPGRALTVCLLAGIVAQWVLYSPTDWRAGSCYGPRFLTDLLPLAVWMLGPVVEALRGAAFVVFIAAVVFSIAVQAIGAFCYPRGGSDVHINLEHSSLPGYVIEARAGIVRPPWLNRILPATGSSR